MGKYSNVLRRYGKAGFGVPSKAPHTGSFPLYPVNRAQYALTIIASPVYDTKRRLRAQVAKRAIEAHPELDSYWNDLQKDTIKPRMRRGTKKAANPRRGSMPRKKNPLGRRPRAGRKATIVRVAKTTGGRTKPGTSAKGKVTYDGGNRIPGKTHLLNPGTGRALCDSAKQYGRLEASKSREVTCYRCLKLMALNRDEGISRKLKVSGVGKRGATRSQVRDKDFLHLQVPGGREGLSISAFDPDSSGTVSRVAQVEGIEYYLGGTREHPTQSKDLTREQKKYRRQELQAEIQGKRTRKSRAAAFLERGVGTPTRKKGARRVVGNPSAKQRRARENATEAMDLYHSGEADSLGEAWDMVRNNPKRRRRRRR